MRPIIISIIVGIGIVIVAAGFLTRDIPMDRISPGDFETQTPIFSTVPIGESQDNFANNPATKDICDVSYPDICIPPYPPDLDCSDIGFSNFRVYQPDPHSFDGDGNGIGCESQPQETQIDPTSLETAGPSTDAADSQNELCLGNARCISGTVVKVVDGDAIQVDDEVVRFALVDAPKMKYDGGKARGFIEEICPVGSSVIVDQDDSQLEDKFGRILGVIYCNDLNLNSELLDLGLAELYSTSCDQSEFSTLSWAQKHGCES